VFAAAQVVEAEAVCFTPIHVENSRTKVAFEASDYRKFVAGAVKAKGKPP
jgi:hypothetical protein